jgi:hypothetical protein
MNTKYLLQSNACDIQQHFSARGAAVTMTVPVTPHYVMFLHKQAPDWLSLQQSSAIRGLPEHVTSCHYERPHVCLQRATDTTLLHWNLHCYFRPGLDAFWRKMKKCQSQGGEECPAYSEKNANWTRHILRRGCLLTGVTEGRVQGRIEVTRRGRRRRKLLLDDLK